MVHQSRPYPCSGSSIPPPPSFFPSYSLRPSSVIKLSEYDAPVSCSAAPLLSSDSSYSSAASAVSSSSSYTYGEGIDSKRSSSSITSPSCTSSCQSDTSSRSDCLVPLSSSAAFNRLNGMAPSAASQPLRNSHHKTCGMVSGYQNDTFHAAPSVHTANHAAPSVHTANNKAAMSSLSATCDVTPFDASSLHNQQCSFIGLKETADKLSLSSLSIADNQNQHIQPGSSEQPQICKDEPLMPTPIPTHSFISNKLIMTAEQNSIIASLSNLLQPNPNQHLIQPIQQYKPDKDIKISLIDVAGASGNSTASVSPSSPDSPTDMDVNSREPSNPPSRANEKAREQRLKFLQERRAKYRQTDECEFSVSTALIGLLIGKHGEKLAEVAKKHKVEIRVLPVEGDRRRVRIYGDHTKAVAVARSELECVSVTDLIAAVSRHAG